MAAHPATWPAKRKRRGEVGVPRRAKPMRAVASASRGYDSGAVTTIAAEMKPWTLGNDDDRPIARRIMEERGVPREAFGWGKKAVAHDLESPRGEALRKVFFDTTRWTATAEAVYRGVNFGLYFAMRGADYARARG